MGTLMKKQMSMLALFAGILDQGILNLPRLRRPIGGVKQKGFSKARKMTKELEIGLEKKRRAKRKAAHNSRRINYQQAKVH
jgi:hypothetical protein